MPLFFDTGVLLSATDADEPRHQACAELLRENRGQLLVPVAVDLETAWLIESRLGPAAEATFLRLITTSVVQVIDLSLPDYVRCVELMEQYADLGLGLVDASIVAVAENRGITTLATLNSRDFSVVRPRQRRHSLSFPEHP